MKDVSPVSSYKEFILSDGWYRSLFNEVIDNFSLNGLFDKMTFVLLTPLYFTEMSLRVSKDHRMQEKTALTWIKRMNEYIDFIENSFK